MALEFETIANLRGPAGRDGSNVLPTDEAMAQTAADPQSEFATQLSATIDNADSVVRSVAGEAPSATTMRLNLALAVPGALVRLIGDFVIDQTLVMAGSLDATQASITLAEGSNCNMLVNKAVRPMRSGTGDAVVDSAARTITSASAAFTATDVGRQVAVTAVGFSGMNVYGTIVSVTAGVATFSGVAIESQSGGVVGVYGRDQAQSLIGGVWDRGGNQGAGWETHAIRLRRTDGLSVRDMTILSAGGKYALSLGDVTNYDVSNMRFDAHSDGVHIQGPARSGSVRNLFGYTGDDLFSITASDFLHYQDVMGDVDGIEAAGLFPEKAHAAFKVISGTGTVVRGVHLDGIYGTTEIRPIAYIGDNTGPSTVDNVVVENVDCMPLDTDASGLLQPIVQLGGFGNSPFTAGSLVFRNVRWRWAAGRTPRGIIHVEGSATRIGTITAEQLEVIGADASMHLVNIDGAPIVGAATVARVVLRDAIYQAGKLGGNAVQVGGSATVGEVVVDGLVMPHAASGTHGAVVNEDGGATLSRVRLSRVRATRSNGVTHNRTSTTMTVSMEDVQVTHPTGGSLLAAYGPWELSCGGGVIDGTNSSGGIRLLGATASGRVLGSCHRANGGTMVERNGSQTVEARDFSFPMRADYAAKVAGAAFRNTLAGSGVLAVGLGPIYCDGNSFKNVATGASVTP